MTIYTYSDWQDFAINILSVWL